MPRKPKGPSEIDEDGNELYEIGKILNSQGSGKKKFYQIRWKGYTSVDDTWESAAKIKRTAPDELAKFLREQRERKLVRPRMAAKAKNARQDGESDAQDEDEQDDENGDDDGSETGSADADERGGGGMQSDDDAPTKSTSEELSPSAAAAQNGIVCASLFVAPSCKSDICQLCFALHAHITALHGGASEAEISDADPNQLVRCITCRVPVHLACLGDQDIMWPPAKSSHSAAGPGERAAAASFQCPACAAGLHSNSLQCVLCDRSGSLLQKVCFGVDDKSASSGTVAWAHALCMRWTPDLWFDYSLRDEVNISAIKDNRRRLKCSFCKKSAGSRAVDGHALALPHSCIQCQSGKCMQSFHVSCAAERGLLHHNATNLKWVETGEKQQIDALYALCSNHHDKEWDAVMQRSFVKLHLESCGAELDVGEPNAGSSLGHHAAMEPIDSKKSNASGGAKVPAGGPPSVSSAIVLVDDDDLVPGASRANDGDDDREDESLSMIRLKQQRLAGPSNNAGMSIIDMAVLASRNSAAAVSDSAIHHVSGPAAADSKTGAAAFSKRASTVAEPPPISNRKIPKLAKLPMYRSAAQQAAHFPDAAVRDQRSSREIFAESGSSSQFEAAETVPGFAAPSTPMISTGGARVAQRCSRFRTLLETMQSSANVLYDMCFAPATNQGVLVIMLPPDEQVLFRVECLRQCAVNRTNAVTSAFALRLLEDGCEGMKILTRDMRMACEGIRLAADGFAISQLLIHLVLHLFHTLAVDLEVPRNEIDSSVLSFLGTMDCGHEANLQQCLQTVRAKWSVPAVVQQQPDQSLSVQQPGGTDVSLCSSGSAAALVSVSVNSSSNSCSTRTSSSSSGSVGGTDANHGNIKNLGAHGRGGSASVKAPLISTSDFVSSFSSRRPASSSPATLAPAGSHSFASQPPPSNSTSQALSRQSPASIFSSLASAPSLQHAHGRQQQLRIETTDQDDGDDVTFSPVRKADDDAPTPPLSPLPEVILMDSEIEESQRRHKRIVSDARNEQTADEKRADIALQASLITVLSAPSSLSLSSILRARAAEKSVHGRIKWRDSIPGSELSDYSEHHEPQHRQQPQQHQPQQHQPQQQQQQESLPLLEFNQHADDRCLDRADCWFYNKNNKCFKAESCVYRHCFAARESSEQCQGFLMYRRCPDPMRCNRRHDLQPAALRAAAAPSHHVVEESLVELDLNNPDLLNESALETFEISKVVAQCGVSRAKAVRALNQSANKTAHGAFLILRHFQNLHPEDHNLHETDQNLGGRDCCEYDGTPAGCFRNRDCTKRHCWRALGSAEPCPSFVSERRCDDPKSCKLRHGVESAARRADFRRRRDAHCEHFPSAMRGTLSKNDDHHDGSRQNPRGAATSAPAVSSSSASSRVDGNSEAVETVVQMTGGSQSDARRALVENKNEPLTAAIVRQASVCITESISRHLCPAF